jgi:hypothetical protein
VDVKRRPVLGRRSVDQVPPVVPKDLPAPDRLNPCGDPGGRGTTEEKRAWAMKEAKATARSCSNPTVANGANPIVV